MSTETSKLLFYIKARCVLNSSAFVTNEGKLSFDQKEAMPFASGPDALTYLCKLVWDHRREDLGGQTFLVVDSDDKYHHGVSLS